MVLALVDVAMQEEDVVPRTIVVVEQEAEGAHALVAIGIATRLLHARVHAHLEALQCCRRLRVVAAQPL
jgi:hypothetical protein